MFTRNVSFRLKSNMLSDYTRTFENKILPLLRKERNKDRCYIPEWLLKEWRISVDRNVSG
jgi:hypothetical protein